MSDKQRCHDLIGKFYEMPKHNMYGKLLIVTMPAYMEAKDVDLIKTALKHYAEAIGDEK